MKFNVDTQNHAVFEAGDTIVLGPSCFWLVVSTHLKNISQNGNLPQVGAKIKNI